MGFLDFLLVGAVLAACVTAVVIRRRSAGCCSDCSRCRRCSHEQQQKE